MRRFVTGYARVYADIRWRRLHQVGPCVLCGATGKISRAREGRAWSWKPATNGEQAKPCYNCGGTGCGPWGRSSAHRHRDAVRHMVKIVLKDLWLMWREAEGLPAPPPYSVAKLGLREHAGLRGTTETEERAELCETTKLRERAGSDETTETDERAGDDETTVMEERAVRTEQHASQGVVIAHIEVLP